MEEQELVEVWRGQLESLDLSNSPHSLGASNDPDALFVRVLVPDLRSTGPGMRSPADQLLLLRKEPRRTATSKKVFRTATSK